jgi:exosortase
MPEHAPAETVNAPTDASKVGLLEEIADIWNRLPHKTLFLILFAAWIALFHFYGNATLGYVKSGSLFTWARAVYEWKEEDAHGKYIPFAVLLFFWIKRKELSAITPKIWWPGAWYFAGAIFLHFVAYRVEHARISILAFMFGLHALIGMIWGREALRRTIFPVFLLIFCVPLGSMVDPITFSLRIFVTKISVGIAHNILGIQVFRDGSQIMGAYGRALYDVAPACSGIRSLIAMAALAVIYAFLNVDIAWRRAILILCALPLALLSNIARVTTVIIVGDVYSQKLAATIEQKFGFVTFAVAIAGLMVLGWLLAGRGKPPVAQTTPDMEATTA